MERTEYLVIGMGIAGYEAVKEIKKRDPDSMITIIAKNQDLYKYEDRILENVYNKFTSRDEWLKSIDWYYDNDIELVLGAEVEKLDPLKKEVYLKDGRTYGYAKLLIATGTRLTHPIIESEFSKGIVVIKTPEDISIKDFEDCERILILGGGYQQVLEALKFAKMGKKPIIVEDSERLLRPALNDEFSAIIKDALEKAGVEVHMGHDLESVLGSGSFEGVRLSSGEEIKADLLVLNKGMKANIEFLTGSGIDYDIGVLVDEFFRTNVEDVYAAGDCVEYDSQLVGSWAAASMQGKYAGKNMTGGASRYRYPDEINIIQIADKELFTFGQTSSDQDYDIDKSEDSTVQIFYNDENGRRVMKGVVIYGDISERDSFVDRILIG